jgi:hypothetical protein
MFEETLRAQRSTSEHSKRRAAASDPRIATTLSFSEFLLFLELCESVLHCVGIRPPADQAQMPTADQRDSTRETATCRIHGSSLVDSSRRKISRVACSDSEISESEPSSCKSRVRKRSRSFLSIKNRLR